MIYAACWVSFFGVLLFNSANLEQRCCSSVFHLGTGPETAKYIAEEAVHRGGLGAEKQEREKFCEWVCSYSFSVLIMQIKNVSISLYYLQCRKKAARMQIPLSSAHRQPPRCYSWELLTAVAAATYCSSCSAGDAATQLTIVIAKDIIYLLATMQLRQENVKIL